MIRASRSIGETDIATTPKGLLCSSQTRGLRISCADKAANLATQLGENLLERLGVELGERVVFHRKAYFDGMAANFTVFDVSLARHGCVENHGDFFAAVWTLKRVFHIQTVQYFRAM
jgi:hypothetical protein